MILETFGSLIKEENLRTIKDGTIPNTFVLENSVPFPGYYGAVPSDKVADSFFLIMTQKESTEKILRITDIIRKNSGINFEGSPTRICVNNDTYYGIRVRGLKDFTKLEEIQNYYRDNGINYLKSKNINTSAVIQIKKIFRIENVTETIFKDTEWNVYYLKINEQLTWSHFRTLTFKLKNNISNTSFDAALAVIYGREVTDVIRIFAKEINMDMLENIHAKYNELLEKGFK